MVNKEKWMIKLETDFPDEKYHLLKDKYVINKEGFGFKDKHKILVEFTTSFTHHLALLGKHFFDIDYKKMLQVFETNDNLKREAQHTFHCYLRIKLPFLIKGQSRYIKLIFVNNNLVEALKQMVKIKENNVLKYMKQQYFVIYGVSNGNEDEYTFDKYFSVFNDTESINFFDLLPIIRMKDLRNKVINDKKLYRLPLVVDNKNINIPSRFSKYMNNAHKYAMSRWGIQGREFMYNTEVSSILKDSNLKVEGTDHTKKYSNTFLHILKIILEYIKENDDSDDDSDDKLNNFIDLLLVMSINQIRYTRYIAKEDKRQLNFLNWYYYIEVERQIDKVVKTPSHFFYKLFYGNFHTLELVDREVINVIYPFYVEVMLLILDQVNGYIFKNFFDEKIIKIKYEKDELENTLKRIDYIKLIYFFEKIVKKDEKEYNEKFPYNSFRENNPDLKENFELFSKIKLNKENIQFLTEINEDSDDGNKDKPESKLKLVPDSDSDSD